MSFGPPRFISPIRKDKSPPRSSAEVAAKFDANIRAFDPRRRVSPKDFLRRKLPVSISPPPSAKRSTPDRNASGVIFAFPNQQKNDVSNQNKNGKFSPNNNNNGRSPTTKGGNSIFQALAATSAKESKRKLSPLARYYASQERRPTNIFGTSSKKQDDIFGSSDRFANKSGFERSDVNNNDKDHLPFYKHDEVSSFWIRVHAKMTETLHVESLIRERIENLELEHIKLMLKFKNEFVV